MVAANERLINENLAHEILDKCFTNAVTEVIRTAAGLEVYEDKNHIEQNKSAAGYVSGIMFLCGQKDAILSITISQDAVSTLITYMTGDLSEEIEREELCDGVAELTNMIAGRAKVDLLETDYHFSITPPFSIVGEDFRIVYKSSVPRIHKKFVADDITIFLEVAYI